MNYEEVPGTWAFELKDHWKAFCAISDLINEKGNQGKVDRLKFREYLLWDMQNRHEKEVNDQAQIPCDIVRERWEEVS